MARNCEKHFVGLNRVFLEEQWKREEELKRPPLYKLQTAEEVRKWIPSISKEIDYCLRQLSGARGHDYQESKKKEFEQRVQDLEKERKRFIQKVYQLDPTQKDKGVPWQPKSYVSKRKLESVKDDGSTSSTTTSEESQNETVPTRKKKKPIVLNILNKEKKKADED